MPSRRSALFLAVGLLVYAGTLVITAPAAWLTERVERASGERLALREPTGSAWAGTARVYLRGRPGELLDLGALRWNARLSSIGTGKLGADLTLGGATGAVHLDLGPSSISLRDMKVTLPGRILASVVPGLAALGPEGSLHIESDGLRVERDSILGSADVQWRDVRLARSRGLDLGSHVARLRGGGSNVDIELTTLEGPLRLKGAGTWKPDAGLEIAGIAEHAEDPAGKLTELLQGLCAEYRNRRCEFRVKP
jgi:hypothetical protein